MESDRPLSCPECGHELSMYEAPEAAGGERAAAHVAAVVASWAFPTTILVSVVIWGLVNIILEPFEPYPVIVLAWISAVLATVAACQGPLILLAQRRAAMNDRARDEETFRVATNAEADIHELRRAVDALHATVASQAGKT